MAQELNNKQQLIVNLMTSTLDKASRDSISAMLKRHNSVRVAKIANFAVSGTKLSDLFSTDELYAITNAVYWYAEDLLAPSLNGIQDDKLLKQLKAK
jgi:hypothetical protein